MPVSVKVGDWVKAWAPGDGSISGIVSQASYSPTRGERMFTIDAPDDGRRAVCVFHSEIEEVKPCP